MKISLRVLSSAFVLGLAVSAVHAQTANPAKLKFRGIGLDSTFAQVVKALGKPKLDGKAMAEECVGGLEKDVEYDGAKFHFMNGDSKGGKTFEVKSFEVTDAKFVVSGVKVGDPEALVRKMFGRKYTTDKDPDSGETIWHYAMNDREGPGTTTFKFKNGKVTFIASDFQVC